MEADTASERLSDPAPVAEPAPYQRPLSAWEAVDEEWDGRDEAPMCM
jgi:hypothetical protein